MGKGIRLGNPTYIMGPTTCPICKGKGRVVDDLPCHACNGSGEVRWYKVYFHPSKGTFHGVTDRGIRFRGLIKDLIRWWKRERKVG